MKKPLLISLSLLSAGLITGIYAQTNTAGTSIVDKMKAAAHSFTLTTTLNTGETGLTSDPVKGKKTGDILTAGEWNRVLELVADGSSTGSVNYMQLTTPASVTFTEGGKVPFTTVVSQKGSQITQSGGEITLKGGNSYVISADIRLTSPNSAIGYTIINKSDGTGVGVYGANYTGIYTDTWATTSAIGFVSPTVDTTYFVRTSSLSGVPGSNHNGGNFTVWELGGGGDSGGATSGWVDVPLTDTNPFDQQCMYRFVTQGQTYYAETVHENRLYWIYNMYFEKANKSVLVGGIAPFDRATKIEKLCGGGGTIVAGGGLALHKCTNTQSLDTTNAPCYGASRNGGFGDGRYRVLSCQFTNAGYNYTMATTLTFSNNLNQNVWSLKFSDNYWVLCNDGSVLVVDTQASGGSAASSWKDVPLTDTADYDTSCEYKMKVNNLASAPGFAATGDYWYFATAVGAKSIIYVAHESQVTHVNSNSKNSFRLNGASINTVLQMQKRCN